MARKKVARKNKRSFNGDGEKAGEIVADVAETAVDVLTSVLKKKVVPVEPESVSSVMESVTEAVGDAAEAAGEVAGTVVEGIGDILG